MRIITVDFTIRAEHVSEFRDAILANAQASVTAEPGCHQFDVCFDPKDETRVFLYEVYDDAAAFDAHRATPHFKAFDRAAGEWVANKSVAAWDRAYPKA